jgi:hypothetical protein
MVKIIEELMKKGYQITNKRVMGNTLCTSEETRKKDLIQEYALITYWILDKFGIWVYSEYDGNYWIGVIFKNMDFYEVTEYTAKNPLEAIEKSLEYLLNNNLLI